MLVVERSGPLVVITTGPTIDFVLQQGSIDGFTETSTTGRRC